MAVEEVSRKTFGVVGPVIEISVTLASRKI